MTTGGKGWPGRRYNIRMAKRIAIVEDEAELAALVEYNLTRGGFQSRILPGGAGTLRELQSW
jgi:DNA-binding response OmpR family regulator